MKVKMWMEKLDNRSEQKGASTYEFPLILCFF